MIKDLQSKLDSLVSLKDTILSKQEELTVALDLTNKSIENLQTELDNQSKQLPVIDRYSMLKSETVKEFAIANDIFEEKDSSFTKQQKFFEYLKTQTILNYYLAYHEEGINLVNELISSVYNVK